jgi:hypothetical protein
LVTERNRTAMHGIAVCGCTFQADFVAWFTAKFDSRTAFEENERRAIL